MTFDAVVIGAGAAGLFYAGIAGQLGRKVLLIDHAPKIAEKIRISGGGRCNFTNQDTSPHQFLSGNPHFCRSALARYTPQDFLDLLRRHRIPWHEKHKGQLFCDESAQNIITMLLQECDQGGVTRWQPCTVQAVRQINKGFELDTNRGAIQSERVIVATGGLSIPKIGATDFGYRLARQFGHHIVETRPALVPLTFDPDQWAPFAALAGLSLPVQIGANGIYGDAKFSEDLLFTHRGLSGPAVLQISSYWQSGSPIRLDLAPGIDLANQLGLAKSGSRRKLGNELAALIPARLANLWLSKQAELASKPVAEIPDKELKRLAQCLHAWSLTPVSTEGYRKAEVTIGGVDTRELSSQTFESQRVPGLYFIGEVVDVTGWLGGYNFQWAWASAAACARAVA